MTVVACGCLNGLEVGSRPHERHESVLCRERAGDRFGGSAGSGHVGFRREAFLACHRDAWARVRDHERDGRVGGGDLEHDPAALAVAEQAESCRIDSGRLAQAGQLRRDIGRLLGGAGVAPVAGRLADAALVERGCGDAAVEQAGADRREVDVVVAIRTAPTREP